MRAVVGKRMMLCSVPCVLRAAPVMLRLLKREKETTDDKENSSEISLITPAAASSH